MLKKLELYYYQFYIREIEAGCNVSLSKLLANGYLSFLLMSNFYTSLILLEVFLELGWLAIVTNIVGEKNTSFSNDVIILILMYVNAYIVFARQSRFEKIENLYAERVKSDKNSYMAYVIGSIFSFLISIFMLFLTEIA